MREQGGVTAAGSGAGAGAFIAYEFTAQTPEVRSLAEIVDEFRRFVDEIWIF